MRPPDSSGVLVAGIALCCTGDFEDKVKFCFEIFDFNFNASLDKNEMLLMMQCR